MIERTSLYCGKEYYKDPTNHSRYINGRSLKIYYCKICKKKISYQSACYGSGMCKPCSIDSRKIRRKLHYCIGCGKEISRGVKTERCRSCAGFFRRKPKNYCIDCRKEIDRRSKRCNKCQGKIQSVSKQGKGNYNYINGLHKNKYNSIFFRIRKQIRERDNFICQGEGCKMTQQQHKKKYNRALEVHHIDYNKENCKEKNFITLCKLCHGKTNYNRDYWYAYYTYIMEERYAQL